MDETLARRLELFIDGFARSKDGHPTETYAEALARANALRGETVALDRILAIGDGPETDIRGAAGFGIDAVLVADGIAGPNADPATLEAEALRLVPQARIVATRRSLDWAGA